jgi:hypothetical protein
MASVIAWVNGHDPAKLLIIAIGTVPMILVAISGSDAIVLVLLLAAAAIWGGGGYWVGNRTWLLIPLVAMAVEIAIAIPFTLADSHAEETPLSVIVEAPFWTGIPALLAAWVGQRLKRARATTARPGRRTE